MLIRHDIDDLILKGKDGFPKILLLHGLNSNGSEMRELGRFLHKNGFSIMLKKYPGHGKEITDFYNSNVEQWFESAKNSFIQLSNQPNDIIVCGLSMGGSFALKLASMYNVLGLITMNAPVFGFSNNVIDQQIELEISKNSNNVSFNKQFIEQMKTVKKGYSDFVDYLGSKENLSLITANTLIIQGLKDDERFIKSSKAINDLISSNNKKIKYFEQSGHIITIDINKKEVFKTVLNFVLDLR